MNFFPQLASGAITQYPSSSTLFRRTVVNEAADGRQIRWPDLMGTEVHWECALTEISDGEWSALRDLFKLVEGRLKTFTFFSPYENLLAWSEEFTRGIWVKEALLTLTEAVDDPFGGTAAYRAVNTAAVGRRISQTVQVPATYQTCFSVWIRGGSVVLTRSAGSVTESRGFTATGNWKRVSFEGVHSAAAESTTFGVQIAAGGSCDLFGAQLDLQPAAADYVRSAGRSGVYVNARFDDDRLNSVALGPGRKQIKIRVTARVED